MADELFLELTSRCTLACPACPRTIYRGTYAVGDLAVDVVRLLLQDGIPYRHIILSGNHGDPIYHPKFHEIISLLQQMPGEPSLGISTNGSYRDKNWWMITAQLLRGKDSVTFGVDGLADTAEIYRRNISWDSVMAGVAILKEHSSCHVNWQWILFRYNEHQLAEARRVSERLGFDSVEIVKSFRDEIPGIEGPTITLGEAYERFVGPNSSPL